MAKTARQYEREIEELRVRLREAEETLEAISTGAVDAIVVSQGQQQQVFTLQGAESAYRILLEKLSEGAATLAPDGTIVYCNARFAEILARPLDQVLGTTIEQYVHPADRTIFAAMLRQASLGDSRGEVRFQCRDAAVPLHLSLAPLADSPVASVCMVATDLTERKRAEQVLASEHFIRRLIDRSPIGVAVVGRDMRHILANPAYRAIAGDPDRPVPGHTIAEVFPPQVARMVESFVRRGFETGESLDLQDCETPVRGRTWWNVSGIPLRDAAGHIEAVLVLTQEVTERKQAEEALRVALAQAEEGRRILDALMEYVPDGITIADAPDVRIRRVSRYGLELVGKPREVFEGISADERSQEWEIYEADGVTPARPEDFPLIRATRKGEIVLNEEWVLGHPSGERIPVLCNAAPIRDQSGAVIGGVVVWRDIRDRKMIENHLRTANEILEQRVDERTAEVQRRVAQLRLLAAELTQAEQRERRRLAMVLHDHLQQLLVGMKFSISMLREHITPGDGPQVLQQLDDLLNQSIETSRSLTIELCPPILTQGSMSEVLHWLAGWFASKHGLRVEVRTDEQVHPPAEQVRVLLFHATRELLFNTVKHAGVSEALVEMARLNDDRVCITVADAGVGFDPARVKSAGAGQGGFGLFSLRERLEMIGGQLQIESAPGSGTRSTLIAPMQLADIAGAEDAPPGDAWPPSMPPIPPAEHAGDRLTIRVLLADDHQIMRDGLARLLRTHANIEVVGQAADGLQAVNMALRLRPDIVIMDVSMPHIDGVEATRRIRASLPATRIIGLSMFSESNVQEAMLDAGAAAYLAKTSPPEALITAIRQCRNVAL